MSKILVVVESPAKAKTIGKFLGKKYTVKACMGHVRDLPKSQFGIDVEQDFEPKYITIRGKGELIQELKSATKKSASVLLATDPDREGEAIAWHLAHILNLDMGEKCRIEFNEITKKAVEDAVKNARSVDIPRVEAQQARRVLDRIVGYKLSPLLWKKVRKGLSAGRVQSVALRLICDREEEILKFLPEEYWDLKVKSIKEKQAFWAKLVKIGKAKALLTREDEVAAIKAAIAGKTLKVDEVKKKAQQRHPAPPFTTSSLQQEAFRKYNFTAKRTMMVAQQLYEGLDLGKKEGLVGLITYIRTDSMRISDEAREEAKAMITERFGPAFYPKTPRVYANKGKIQDSHESIRPSSVYRTPEEVRSFLTNDQYKLYKLIWERMVASQMSSLIQDVTTVDMQVDQYTFRSSGVVVTFPGFTKLYEEGQDAKAEEEDQEEKMPLPFLESGDVLPIEDIQGRQHFTQPPPRYTEATLIKTMEELGIGRPSTYAPTIDTLTGRGYVTKEKRLFSPTELGILVLDLLTTYFPNIIDRAFTARMESQLDAIENGEQPWKELVREFYKPFIEEIKVAEEAIGNVELKDEISDEICEKCGSHMVIKHGRYGKFLACPNFPECRNTKAIVETLKVKCPECKEGDVVVRNTKKKRKFYGCSRYPECDYTSWNEPTSQTCPECGQTLEKRPVRGDLMRLMCPNKDCKYTTSETKASQGSKEEA